MNEFTLERRLHNVNSVARVLSKCKTQVIVKEFTLRKSLRNEKFIASVLQKAETLEDMKKCILQKGRINILTEGKQGTQRQFRPKCIENPL